MHIFKQYWWLIIIIIFPIVRLFIVTQYMYIPIIIESIISVILVVLTMRTIKIYKQSREEEKAISLYFSSNLERKRELDKEKDYLIVNVQLNEVEHIIALHGTVIFSKLLDRMKKRLLSNISSNSFIIQIAPYKYSLIIPMHNSKDCYNELISRLWEIKNKLEQPYQLNRHTYYLKTEFGMSVYIKGDRTPIDKMIHLTDLAIIERKEQVKPEMYLYDNRLLVEIENKQSMKIALKKAIQNNEFEVMYQPIKSLIDTRISLEALVRWNYNGQWIAPDVFIPLLRSLKLIEELTLLVARKIAQDWKECEKRIDNLSYIAINISPELIKGVNGEKTLQRLKYIFLDQGIIPERICLEITEDVLLDSNAKGFFDANSHEGFLIAIDDFGTGFSSMSYLSSYSFDILKLDRSFINERGSDSKQKEVIASIVQLAKNLGMYVIAEGIESREDLSLFSRLGVHAIQGYYYSEPQFINEWKLNHIVI